MAQTKVAPKSTAPDKSAKKFKYQNPFSLTDPLQSKFVQSLMKNGKKNLARQILHDTFDEINRRTEDDSLKIFEKAISNSTPAMECRAKRVGGAVYQIPIEVSPQRQKSLPIRWILEGARKKKGQPMHRRLATELIDSANEAGFAFGKREEAHKMAQSNKAFAHLARY